MVLISIFLKIGFSVGDVLLILLQYLVGNRINIIWQHSSTKFRQFRIICPFLLYFLQDPDHETDKRWNYTGYQCRRSNYLGPNFRLHSYKNPFFFFHYMVEISIVTALTHSLVKPIRGRGGATSTTVPPLNANLTAILLTLFFHIYDCPIDHCRFDKAYVGCVIGTLLRADILKFGRIKNLETLGANIGAAGILEAIFFNGVMSSS